MDSLTQIVLGAAAGEAVLGKKVGNKAMFWGAVAGTIPDLDVMANFFTDTVSAIEIHRGFSHSIFFAILGAPIFGWLVWLLYKKQKATWKDWSWLFFWGLFTHPLLDAFTTWGTQLFWPLKIRLAFQSIFVIDPLYTLPFLVLLILAMRHAKGSKKRKRFNKLGLLLSTLYLAIGLLLKGFAYQEFVTALEEQGIAYREIDTRPSPFNTMLWMANVELEESYLIGTYSLFDSKPISYRQIPKNHHVLEVLKYEDKIQRLITITEGWYAMTKKGDNIFFNDLRFGLLSLDPNEEQFAFSYELKETENGLEVNEVPKFREDGKKLIFALWERIKGN
ncbi:metal-dependent hydrolase [Croceitalea sp. MTPC5]|uniref:metal-dependent hydrolase n=1 Tax=Croceitalea sp. MTPC5 TaxID=3056565 RepID=UPI002B3A2BA8|nr:metal-dependent hydrolase [Croceitalea sp. MTPC5]